MGTSLVGLVLLIGVTAAPWPDSSLVAVPSTGHEGTLSLASPGVDSSATTVLPSKDDQASKDGQSEAKKDNLGPVMDESPPAFPQRPDSPNGQHPLRHETGSKVSTYEQSENLVGTPQKVDAKPLLSKLTSTQTKVMVKGQPLQPTSFEDCGDVNMSEEATTAKKIKTDEMIAQSASRLSQGLRPWDLSNAITYQPPVPQGHYADRRVAFCIAGQLRQVGQTVQKTLDHVIGPLNADIFVHTSQDDYSQGAQNMFPKERLAAYRAIPTPIDPSFYIDDLAGNQQAMRAWRDSGPPGFFDGTIQRHYGKLEFHDRGNGFIGYTHMYGCAQLIRAEEQKRGSQYEFVALGRSDYAWTADHVPLSMLSASNLYSPDNGNDFNGLTDMYMIGGRAMVLSYMSMLKDVAQQTAKGVTFMNWKHVPIMAPCPEYICLGIKEVNPERKLAEFIYNEGVPVIKLANTGFLQCACGVAGGGSGSETGCKFDDTVQAWVKETDHGVTSAARNGAWISRCGWAADMLGQKDSSTGRAVVMESTAVVDKVIAGNQAGNCNALW